jgi:ABC-type antimicrobial peptide transport system permease subunit
MSLVLLGTVGGVPLAIAASQLLSSHLAGLPPSDPVTWSGMTLAFALMGLLACCAPLIRALRIAPAEILHET